MGICRMGDAMVKGTRMPMTGIVMTTDLTTMTPDPYILTHRPMAVAHLLPKRMTEPSLKLWKKKNGIVSVTRDAL